MDFEEPIGDMDTEIRVIVERAAGDSIEPHRGKGDAAVRQIRFGDCGACFFRQPIAAISRVIR